MGNQKGEENLEYKSRQRFMCCPCFGRKKASSISTIIGLTEPNEPYDYVVEKLAIKRVPLRLFATPEDLEKHSQTISSTSTPTPSIASQKSEKKTPTTTPVEEKSSSVTFSAYYKLIPIADIDEHVSQTTLPQQENSVTSLPYEPEKDVVCNATFQQQSLPKKVMTEDQERELVAHILNKHSSLFTLDMKNPIPKDPDHLPKNKVVVPSPVQAVIRHNRQEQFPPIHGRRQIAVDVHRTSVSSPAKCPSPMPPMKYQATIPSSKKELTPELKQTINALGLAQRPHIPGLPPKNQRSIQGETVSNRSAEKEMCCNVLAADEVTEEMPSHEMACHHLEGTEKGNDKRVYYRKKGGSKVMESSCEESDYDASYGSSGSKMQSSEGNMPRFSKNITIQQCSATLHEKSILAVPNRSSNQSQTPPVHEAVGISEPRMQDSEQITEISQLKGQSLKWKIIIKHHSDKNEKEDKKLCAKSDDSDTDSESKIYMRRSRSSSPHR